MVRRLIRKYLEGANLPPNDSSFPTAQLQVYARSRFGETFPLYSLEEGLLHLLSNEGYRLSLWEYSEAYADESPGGRVGVTFYRDGDSITTVVHSEYNEWTAGEVKNKINFSLQNGSGPWSSGHGFSEIVIDGS